MSFIDEIFIMDDIFSIEKRVAQEYGIPIPNVSYWNSSTDFQRHMAQSLVLPPQSLPWNYYYSYSISKEEIRTLQLEVPPLWRDSLLKLLLQYFILELQ